MSAHSDAQRTNLIFFTPTAPVYIAIVYKVVSVDPIIVAAIKPILLSTPDLLIISVAIAIEALPDMGLINANGIISLGNSTIFKKTVVIHFHSLYNMVIEFPVRIRKGNRGSAFRCDRVIKKKGDYL